MKLSLCVFLFFGTLVAIAQESPNLYPFREGDKVGWINNKGEIVIKPEFYSKGLPEFHEGMAIIQSSDGEKYGFVNDKGEVVIEPRYDRARNFSEGYAAVDYPFGRCGYINKKGEWVIEPQFFLASDFKEGYASVRKKDEKLEGYINKKGEFVIEPLYNNAGDFCNGRAVVEVDGEWGVIDTNGKFVYPPRYASARLSDNGECGLWAKARLLGLYNWQLHLWQLMKPDGQIIKTRDELFTYSGFSEGLAEVGVVMDKTYANCATRNYFIDLEGRVAIDHDLDDRYSMISGDGVGFSEGFAAVLMYDRIKEERVGYGYIDKKGNIVISPQFKDAKAFKNGLAYVKINDKKSGYINKKGEVVFSFKNKN